MPLNAKGKEIKRNMEAEYGPEKGKKVFYASENKGTIHGVTKEEHKKNTEVHTKRHHMALKMSKGKDGMSSLMKK